MAKITIGNIYSYLLGNYRYKLYYSLFRFLIRTHIREQIDSRIKSMDRKCYNDGTCKLCGCATTALQMANKACDKPCYPKMVDHYKWLLLNKGYSHKEEGITWILKHDKTFKNFN